MSLVAKLLDKAESEPGLHFRNPRLPHACSIPGGLCIGSKIYIHGMVPKDSNGFAINLQRGADPDNADLHLHIRARLGDAPLVVRNSRCRGSWGVEEPVEGPFPFPVAPRPFLLVLSAYVDCYEVEINGFSNFSFKVRDGLPLSAVTHLAIEAGLFLWSIHEPVESMPRNLRLSIPGGAQVGDLFLVEGEPTDDAKSFVVNWQSGPGKFDDILFHLNPKLEDGRVVRNSRTDDEWGKEESSSETPFKAGHPFSLQAAVSSIGFETYLDGKEWNRFSHRHDSAGAVTLFLEGDLKTTNLRIDSSKMDLASALNGTNLKSRGVRLQHFFQEMPFSSRVTGGFENGCLLFLSAKVDAQPTEFSMNLQCGDGSDCDVALRYRVQWQEGVTKLTLNSREEDTWGQEVCLPEERAPSPGTTFDLLIAREEGGFHCFMDGLELTTFPYRIDDNLTDHLVLEGDVRILRTLIM